MKLDELLRGIEIRGRRGGVDAAAMENLAGPDIRGLAYDSRRVTVGSCFVAIRGELTDGNQYVDQALAAGAAAIVSEAPAPRRPASASGEDWSGDRVWMQVNNARVALAQAAANWFGHPAEKLALIGVTGTNGKTTTTLLIEALLRAAGVTSGLLGTIEYHLGDEVLPAPHTTPESYELQSLLARMTAAGCRAAVMEVSSHALAMERVWGCQFEVAVFTNLTQDHLDYHHTMGAYRDAKRRLFEGVGASPPRAAVVNMEDPATPEMIKGYKGEVLGYGFSAAAGLRATRIETTPAGTRFQLSGTSKGATGGAGEWRAAVTTPLLGRVNVLNALAALGAGLSYGLERETMLAALSRFTRVRGRFERVFAGQPFTVVVDYAHTPDALANLLAIARELIDERGRLLLVFGCGGDRDRAKRPLMGALAAQEADWVLVTSDNPRGEDPLAIINDILVGARRGPRAQVEAEPDRRAAIARALSEARPGDLVAIAGKGHETVQISGECRLPFDDCEVAREELRALGWGKP